jgi:hypothetical protein
LSWFGRKNGPSQKDKWAMGKKREKEGNKGKMKENKYERKVKGRKIKLGISKLKKLCGKNKRIFHEIGLKGNL